MRAPDEREIDTAGICEWWVRSTRERKDKVYVRCGRTRCPQSVGKWVLAKSSSDSKQDERKRQKWIAVVKRREGGEKQIINT